MTAAEVAKKIQREYELAMNADKNIARMYARIGDGTATIEEIGEFATMSGQHIGNIVVSNLEEAFPAGIVTEAEAIEMIPPSLRTNHEYVSDVARRVQDRVNQKNGIGLKAIAPEFDSDGAIRIATNISAYENIMNHSEDIAAVLENASRKVADRSLEVNAGHFDAAGLETTVVREYDGVGLHDGRDECTWCVDRSGTFSYREAQEIGAFQRHVGCGCIITYMSGRRLTQRQTDWTHNKWEDIPRETLEQRKSHGR